MTYSHPCPVQELIVGSLSPHDFEKNQYCINYSHMYMYTAVKMAFLKNLTLESTDFWQVDISI